MTSVICFSSANAGLAGCLLHAAAVRGDAAAVQQSQSLQLCSLQTELRVPQRCQPPSNAPTQLLLLQS